MASNKVAAGERETESLLAKKNNDTTITIATTTTVQELNPSAGHRFQTPLSNHSLHHSA